MHRGRVATCTGGELQHVYLNVLAIDKQGARKNFLSGLFPA